ncbi:hypothetical protein [Streptomyces virginiae]|uniref:hypothetical protein n=1 Tax=Streptomyces virginiae TaxID=1961 RepID=UPI0036915E40
MIILSVNHSFIAPRRRYQHLGEEFVRRLKAESAALKTRLARRDETIEELTAFKKLALSRIAAQYDALTPGQKPAAATSLHTAPASGGTTRSAPAAGGIHPTRAAGCLPKTRTSTGRKADGKTQPVAPRPAF